MSWNTEKLTLCGRRKGNKMVSSDRQSYPDPLIFKGWRYQKNIISNIPVFEVDQGII